jgi:hypothetical protein
MSRRMPGIRGVRGPGLAAALALLALSATARAQQAIRPAMPGDAQRSGVMTRHIPIQPLLPHDVDRDDFYQTRRGDKPPSPTHPNCLCNSGLYGLPLKSDCAVSFHPYFWGKPGGTYGPQCEKVHWRLVGNFLHPCRPVYYYYQGGSYSPVYDLDPIAPGPGPFPFPLLYKRQHQGG